MRRLNNEVDNLEQRNQQLRSQLDQGTGLLSEAERSNIELQLAINTTRARIVEGQHASTVNYTTSIGGITGRGDNSRVPEALRHDRIRTQLRAELNEINQVISNTNMNDAMTQQIKSWMDQFYSALSCDLDAEETKTQFISLLRLFFKDALSEMPLDVDSRLGRDGQTYALMSLQLNLTSVSNAFRQSSTDPNNRPEFRTTSHSVVKKVAEWLLSRGEILTTDAMRRTFQEQMGGRPLPTIPTDRSERHRRLFEREDAEQPPPNNIEREAAEARARSEREIDAAFAPVINEVREAAANGNAELQAHSERMNAQTNRINDEINQLDQEINELEQRNQRLEENLNDNRVLFTEQERRNAELQIRINEVRKQIEEQKKKKLRRLKKTIRIVAISIVAALLYPEITIMAAKGGAYLQGGVPF
jgi:HAMP domain-containing protein